MLRLKLLAFLWLGVLVSCGPAEQAPPVPRSLSTRSDALDTKDYTVSPNLGWSGSSTTTGGMHPSACFTCAGDSTASIPYACTSDGSTPWPTDGKAFTDPIPTGAQVTKVTVTVYGTQIGGSNGKLAVALNDTPLVANGSDANLTKSSNCGAASCDGARTFTLSTATDIATAYHYGGTDNKVKLTASNMSGGIYCAAYASVTVTATVPHISVSPSNWNFNERKVGSSITKEFVVTNTGPAPLNLTAVSLVGSGMSDSDPSSFSWAYSNPSTPATGGIAQNGTQGITVTFSPTGTVTSATTVSAKLQITNNDTDSPMPTYLLSGTKVSYAMKLDKAGLDFGSLRVNQVSSPQTVTVSNISSTPLVVTNVTASANFAVDGSTSFTIPANGSQTVGAKFAPTTDTPAPLTGTLTIQATGETDATVTLSGTGIKPVLGFSSNPVVFSPTRVQTSSAAQTWTISNTGTGPITLNLSRDSNPDFTFSPALPTSLPLSAGGSATYSVTFTPSIETVSDLSVLTLTSSDADYPSRTVTFSGQGVQPNLTWTVPNPLVFGDVRVGSSVDGTIIITNGGSGPVAINTISKSGSTLFSLVSPPTPTPTSTAPLTLNPNDTLTAKVRFSATTESSSSGETGSLLLNTDDVALGTMGTIAIPISGKAVVPNLVLENNTLAFGNRRVGDTFNGKVTLHNTGSGALQITNLDKTGSSSFSWLSPSPPGLPLTLVAGASQDLQVSFTSVAGNQTGNIAVTTDVTSIAPSIALSGNGVQPNLVLPSSPVVIADQRVAETVIQSVLVSNKTGTGPITFSTSAPTISLSGDATFALDSTTVPAPGTVLAAGAELTVNVKFTPTVETTPQTTTLTVKTTDKDFLASTLVLQGKGVRPHVTLSPNPLTFTAQSVGTITTQTLTVDNSTGTGPITITSLSTGSGPFSLVTPPSLPYTLAAQASLPLTVKFTPTSDGLVTGTFTLASGDRDQGALSSSLKGTGQKPILTLTPSSAIPFGEQRVGTIGMQTLTVKNDGSLPLVVSSIAVDNGVFSVSPSAGFSVDPGNTETLMLSFNPATNGDVSANLTLATNDPARASATVLLTGTGVTPTLAVTPTTVSFADQRVGTDSATTKVTVKNSGPGTLHVTSVSVAPSTAYQVSPSTAFDLTKDQTKDLFVTFHPTVEGLATANLILASNDPTASGTVPLSGKGVKPNLTIQPAAINFGNQLVGVVSTLQKVTVHNGGSGTVHVGNVVGNSAIFSISPLVFDLAGGADQDLQIAFRPATKGLASATLSLSTDEATPTANTVALQGTGISDITISRTSADFGTVAKGSTGKINVTLSNPSGVDVKVTGASGVSSPFALVSFAPTPSAPVTVPANSSVSFDISFAPQTQDPFTATLVLLTDDARGSHSLPLTGQGAVAQARFSLASDSSDAAISTIGFGGVRVNASKTTTVKLSNTGDAPLITSAPTLTTTTFSGPTTSLRVEPHAAITFDVVFRPAAKGTYNDVLTIGSNSVTTSDGTLHLGLSGTGAESNLSLNLTNINFGQVLVGQSNGVDVKISNTGDADDIVVNVAYALPFTPDFTAAGSPPPFTVQGNNAPPVTFRIVYKPTRACGTTPDTGTVTLTTDSGRTLTVNVQGCGATAGIGVGAGQTSFDFGNVRVNTRSSPQSLTLSSSGPADLQVTRFNLPTDFAISTESDGGTTLPLTIGAGSSKFVYLTYNPTTLGAVSGAQLSIESNASNALGAIALSGKGVDGHLAPTPDAGANFSSVDVHGPGAQATVVLTNDGEAPVVINTVTVPASAPFSISGLNPGTTVLPKGNISFTASFQPPARGFFSTTANIGTDSVLSPTFALPMQGIGTSPELKLNDLPSFNFGSSNLGESVTQSMTLTNTGEGSLYVSNISSADNGLDGGVGTPGMAADFVVERTDVDAGTTVFPFTVDSHKSQSVRVRFTPSVVGLRQAHAIVSTTYETGDLPLVGQGTDAVLTLSATKMSFTGVVTGTHSDSQAITISNSGDGPLVLTGINLVGSDTSAFSLTKATLPLTLARKGDSTSVGVVFSPTGNLTKFQASLQIISEHPTKTAQVDVTGESVNQPLVLSDSALKFGQQLVTNTSNTRSLTLTNKSATRITLRQASVLDTPGSTQFKLASLSLPLILTSEADGAATQTLSMTFTPQDLGAVTGTLHLTFDGLPAIDVSLSGEGIDSVLAINPAVLDFGGVRVGSGKHEQLITLTNRSDDPITLATPTLKSSTGESYQFDWTPLSKPIGPHGIVILPVDYLPTQEVTSETKLSFVTTVPLTSSAQTLTVTGTASKSLLSVSQSSLDFGHENVTNTPTVMPQDAKTVTVTNRSGQAQNIVVMLKQNDGAAYLLDTSALSSGLAAGASADFLVGFVPQKAGQSDNEVQVWLLGGTEPEATISVTGVGRDITGIGGGCSTGSTEATGVGLLLVLAGVLQRSRRRGRG